jgi:hypothetical protein
MSTRKSNKIPSTTTTWVDDLCPPSQRNSRSGEADNFVAVRQFRRKGRADITETSLAANQADRSSEWKQENSGRAD